MDTPAMSEEVGFVGQDDYMSIRKIAYISTPVEFGGAERVGLSVLQHYRRKDTKLFPIVFCRPWESDNFFINELTRQGIDFSIVPTRLKPREQGRDYFRLLRCVRSIYLKLKKGQFDLVHTNGLFADIVGLIAAKLLRIPIISTCHGFISNDRKLAVHTILDIIALRFMNQIITVSDKIKIYLVDNGVKEKKIKVIQNAVESKYDTAWFQQQRRNVRRQYKIKENEIVLGYIGRLSTEKGIKYLIEAVRLLFSTGVHMCLLIIGIGPQEQELRQIVQRLGLYHKVIFTGFQKDVSGMLPAFDIFVLPSLTEGTSMSLLEAMACGLPVIATAVGGTPKVIISLKNGILVPPESPEAIVNSVMQLIEDESLRDSLINEAKLSIESNFSIKKWIEQIEAIYSEAIDEF